jgi:hypothetical protein
VVLCTGQVFRGAPAMVWEWLEVVAKPWEAISRVKRWRRFILSHIVLIQTARPWRTRMALSVEGPAISLS